MANGKKAKPNQPTKMIGRGEMIRTSDLSVPNRAHYQAVLRPAGYGISFEKRFQVPNFTGENSSGQVKQRKNRANIELFFLPPPRDGLFSV